jgi:hypothetical protein
MWRCCETRDQMEMFEAALMASNIMAGLAGITSDANSLVNFARNAAQKHLFTYDEDIPVEMLVQRLCDMKQGYTQYGGMSSINLFNSPPPYLYLSDTTNTGTVLAWPLTFRAATFRCFLAVHWVGPATRFPAVPLGSIWKLLRLEGDMYRRQPLVRYIATQARLQGGPIAGGRQKPVSEGHEQDDGLNKAG